MVKAIVGTQKNKGKTQKSQTPWGLLGDLEFELADAPHSFSFSEASEFAEHKKIGGKPGLQYTGEAFHSIDLRFRFHSGWCDPDAQLRRLQQARAEHAPMALVLGSGLFAGAYVIETLRTTLEQTDLSGQAIALEVEVKLKETLEPPKPKKLWRSPFVKRV